MREKMILNSKIVLRSEPQYYDTYVAFNYRDANTEFLTNEEMRILEQIYFNPACSMEIAEKTGIKHEKCVKFLKRMIKQDFVSLACEEINQPPKRRKINQNLFRIFQLPFLSAPVSVDIFVTDHCNLKCVHCFSNKENTINRELSLKDLKSIVNQLEELGIFEVRINGGEPLLHSEIERIMEFLKKKRLRKVLLTNGTLLNEKIIKKLKDSEIIPTISLDDAFAQGHDSFRGVKGAFAQTINALKLLRRMKIQYGVNCCLHKKNLRRWGKIVELARNFGAYRIAFLDLKYSDRMKKNPKWIPSYQVYQELKHEIMALKWKYRKIDISLDVFLHCYLLRETVREITRGYVSCQAGKTRMSIDSRGAIYPCNLVISNPEWNFGDSSHVNIQDIWFSDKWKLFRGDVKIKDLRKCSKCENLKGCKDVYCRLLPYITSGDLLGSHPRCNTAS